MRTNTWRAAVVVAVLMIAGACGSSSDGSGSAAGGPPLLPAGAGGAAGGATAAMAPEATGDSSTKSMMPFRAVEYRLADGAKAPASTAAAYQVKPASGDLASKVAKALDAEKDAIYVGPGGFEWSYSGPDGNVSVSSSGSGVAIACAPDGACPDTPTPTPTVPGVPSAGDAEKRVKAMLDDLGASTDGRFEVFGEDGYNRTVVFTPSVDGVPVAGMETSFSFGEQGRIQYANGFVATTDKVGDYPLVGLAEALKRFQEGFGGGDVRTMGAPTVGNAVDPAATDSVSGPDASVSSGGGSDPNTAGGSGGSGGSTEPSCTKGEPCSVPPSPPTDEPTMTIEPDPGTPPVPFEPEIVEITGVDLVLQVVATGCPGDPVYLVPTFALQPGPAGNVTAVEDDALAGTDPGTPVEPCPGDRPPDVPMGKPEPAPMPVDAGREPAKP